MNVPDSRKNTKKYCEYNEDTRHTIEDCFNLKRLIEKLIKDGELKKFISKDKEQGRDSKDKKVEIRIVEIRGDEVTARVLALEEMNEHYSKVSNQRNDEFDEQNTGKRNSGADAQTRGATYHRMINKIFERKIGRNMECYIDDLITLRDKKMRVNPSKCTLGVSSDNFLGYLVSKRAIESNPDKIQAILDMKALLTKKEVQKLTGRLEVLRRFISRSARKSLPFFDTLCGVKEFYWTPECDAAFEKVKDYLSSPHLLVKPDPQETLQLYLTAIDCSVGSILIKDDAGIQTLPRTAVKVQPLADFVTEFSFNTPMEIILDNVTTQPPNIWSLFADDSVAQGKYGGGMILISPKNFIIRQAILFGLKVTNNEAEYEALLAKMRLSKSLDVKSLHAYTDSQLFVKKISGEDDNIREDALSRLATADSKRYKVANHVIIGAILYKKSVTQPLMRCVTPREARLTLEEVHEGKLPKGKGQASYCIITVDYMTKWVEARAVKHIIEDATIKFVKECIIFRYGFPKINVSDNGSQFKVEYFQSLSTIIELSIALVRWDTLKEMDKWKSPIRKSLRELIKSRQG
ncbi:uncharacterized protein LOC141712950 [Apium graveolens]|uniref:uncharacterized protein LOC141712950 n=1 Tax=Apium graveolens TaxID=4045 RepID=UPI003D79B05C